MYSTPPQYCRSSSFYLEINIAFFCKFYNPENNDRINVFTVSFSTSPVSLTVHLPFLTCTVVTAAVGSFHYASCTRTRSSCTVYSMYVYMLAQGYDNMHGMPIYGRICCECFNKMYAYCIVCTL